jgi:hypothetical protein
MYLITLNKKYFQFVKKLSKALVPNCKIHVPCNNAWARGGKNVVKEGHLQFFFSVQKNQCGGNRNPTNKQIWAN